MEVTGIWAGEGPGLTADSLNHSTGRNTHTDTQIRQRQRPTPSVKMHTGTQTQSAQPGDPQHLQSHGHTCAHGYAV